MADTAFSIELQGLTLPDDVKSRLQTELQGVVLAEIAKTDLGKDVNVEPLAEGSDRTFIPFGPRPPILGFVIRNAAAMAAARSADGNVRVAPTAGQAPAVMALDPALPLGGASLPDALEALYYRPDIRAAIASNSRAFAELLSHDDQATTVFNQLIGGKDRLAPLVIGLILLGCAAAGVGVGIWSRK